MLSVLFENIVRMSLSALVVIAAVCLVRLLLLKGPRKFCYILWLAVLIRLLCPFTFTAQVQLQPQQLDRELVAMWTEYSQGSETTEDKAGVQPGPERESPVLDAASIFAHIWLLGMLVMAAYCAFSLIRLKKMLTVAVPLESGIYIADHIGAPFVVGLLRPKIYIPSDLSEGEREYILAHEKHHIRRGDHFAKLLGFAALTVHWFNPLAWLAFRLFVKDMEASCDEAVLSKLGEEVRSDYSQSLLNLAIGRKTPVWMPLAFGEDTKGRIKNVLRWKKPSLAGAACAAAVSVVVLACCMVKVEAVLTINSDEPVLNQSADTAELEQQLNDLSSISGGSIVGAPDPMSYKPLSEGQTGTLTMMLSSLEPEQLGQKLDGMETSFVIKLWDSDRQDISIRFGHSGGRRCLTVNGYLVEDELLAACAYHIYLSFGTQNLCNESLPEGAVLLGKEHGVYTYEFYCESCGQMETASVGHACNCCDWTSNGERFERLSNPGVNHH